MNISALDYKNVISEEYFTPKIFKDFEIPKTDKNSFFQGKFLF